MESNLLIRLSFQVMNQQKLLIRAQELLELTQLTQIKVLLETIMKIEFQSSLICYHQKLEKTLTHQNGQDVHSLEYMMDMEVPCAQIF